MVCKIIAACGGSVHGKIIAIWGLTFKPDTDDMRESPTLPIIRQLIDGGAAIQAFDPEGIDHDCVLEPQAEYRPSPYDAATSADALVLITDWQAFQNPDFVQLKARMRNHVIVDLRNAFSAKDATAAGFAYTGIGLGGTAG